LPNETETPSTQSEHSSARTADEATGHSSSPYQGSRVGNGFEATASQYRAMQEAQLLHEETINQLREEVRGQRERLAELARANPMQRAGQLDVVMLRLTELERKIGEGAPDPLINEIVHRLAALENAGPMRGAKDPRVDEVAIQLDALRQKVSETDNRDSRTDDVVLRIASLEGAFRRAAQSRDPEEVQARIDALSEALSARHAAELAQLRTEFGSLSQSTAEAAAKVADAASADALDALSGRLAGMERRLGESRADERLTELGSQLAALDRKLAEQNPAQIDSRVQALEQRVSQDHTDEVVELIAERLSAVEQSKSSKTIPSRALWTSSSNSRRACPASRVLPKSMLCVKASAPSRPN
jgi:hypothetical protein